MGIVLPVPATTDGHLSFADHPNATSARAGRRLSGGIQGGHAVDRGSPLPLGATVRRGGVNFSIFSKCASAVTLVIFLPDEEDPLLEFPLDCRHQKTGDVWHCFVAGLDPGMQYGYRIAIPNAGHAESPDGPVLLDPFGKAVWGRPRWGPERNRALRSVVVDDQFPWRQDQPLEIPLADSVLYELHVRGFTQDPSSVVAHPGTFLGLVEKIPYLLSLGVTAVELMPVAEFDETENRRIDPATGEPLLDYWGYNPLSFFAPKASYASDPVPLKAVAEFKEMVRHFHSAGIEVIVDVVFNHTGEGDAEGPTRCWRGIDNRTYYLLNPATGAYLDYSGCGNTVNCNHPVVRWHILDALRYWVTEMHVDGFRFDLASILGRGQDGSVMSNPPLLERIAADPILAGTKLIAEAWDAAGLYQVGSFPAWGRWAEWNGRFRDDLRRFVKGDPGMVPVLATRLTGSADLYQGSGREPFHSINFITCHDGFTLTDLVAYNQKQNQANGEKNRDGSDDNFSWNCGAEADTDDPEVLGLRRRQVRNLAALLLLSHGTPMILAGDEIGRTQGGNNNAYCQDNPTTWTDWRLAESQAGLLRFFRNLIAFRRRHAILRSKSFLPDASGCRIGIEWHGVELHAPDWSPESHLLGLHLFEPGINVSGDQIYLIANAHWESHDCAIPRLAGQRWHRFLDTTLDPPDDVAESDEAAIPLLQCDRYCVGPRSVVVLVVGS